MDICIGVFSIIGSILLSVFSIINMIDIIEKGIYVLLLFYSPLLVTGLYLFFSGLNLILETKGIVTNLDKTINILYKLPILLFLIIWIGMIVFFAIMSIKMQQFIILLFLIPFIFFALIIIRKYFL